MKHRLKTLLIASLLAVVILPVGMSCSRTPETEGDAEEHAEGEHAEGEHAEGEHAGGEHAEGEEHEEGVVTLTPEAQARAGIRIAPVETRSLVPEIETTGQVGFNEDRMAHVGPRIAGRITSVRATLGQKVGSGAVLAVIDSVELGQARAAYQQARAREELTRETYERERRLAADKISSKQEELSARAAHLEAAAELRRAEETLRVFGLSAAQIRSMGAGQSGATLSPVSSPFSGTVVEKDASLGEMVAPEQKLFTVADLSRVWIWIDVFERDLGRVHLGDGALVEVEAYPGETFAGEVTFLGGGVNTATRAVRARLEIDNGDGRLRPGMFARIRLSDPHAKPAERGASVPVVPDSAIQRQGEEFIAFVLEGERQYRRREVRTGKRSGGFVEVLEGLRPGDRVVVEGAFLLASEISKESMGGGHDH